MIVRWGLDELGPVLDELGAERPLLVSSERWSGLPLPVGRRWHGARRHTPAGAVADARAAAEGAGVRQVIEDELRRVGVRLRELDVPLELGLQESVRSAVRAGFGVTFISRSAVESDLAAGTIAAAQVEGLAPAREISLVRAAGRVETRVARAFVEFGRKSLAAP